MTAYIDTNVLVAAANDSHEYHDESLAWIRRGFEGHVQLVTRAHTFCEAYSTLTGSPPPLRTAPEIAIVVLKNYSEFIKTVPSLDGLIVVQEALERGVRGSTIHDLAHVMAAEGASIDQLVTFNTKHFAPYWRGRKDVRIGV